jgi:hypothetical protein
MKRKDKETKTFARRGTMEIFAGRRTASKRGVIR